MEPDYVEALRYLSSPAGSFWKWDEQGAIVVWSNGSTLAFREELTILLERLAPTGLPAFDSVLLLLAATREYWPEDSLPLQHRLRTRDTDEPVEESFNTFNSFCSVLFQRLEVIHELPDDLIRSVHTKTELAAIVFERAPRVASPAVAEFVIAILAKHLNRALPNLGKLRGGRVQTGKALIHDLFPLCHGLKGISKESLQLRYQTGLDIEPEPVVVDHTAQQPVVRSLLQELARDSELSGLSRLARNLAAVVQLPRSISESNELPLGGVSDLTNRGSLDRLLLSELAHDDLMLATRVALNEALYLRREIPPSYPPKRCHVLVDAGLRMWGVPRVYATAVVLSLAVTGEAETTLSAYRAAGSEVVSIDLSTREGLIEHLGVLEPSAHPGDSLDAFFQRVDQVDSPSDVVLITTEAVLRDAAFQRKLADVNEFPLYIATVNREGDFQLWSYGPHGRKSHSTLHLDLDAILNQAKVEAPKLIDKTIDPNLPAIFRISPFPFRLPFQFRDLTKQTAWSVPLERYRERMTPSDPDRDPKDVQWRLQNINHGVMVVTRERQLLFHDDHACGPRQIADGLPFGKCLHAWPSDDELTMYAAIYREAERAIYRVTVPLMGGDVHSLRLSSKYLAAPGSFQHVLGATAYGSVVFIIYKSFIEAFEISTGEPVGATTYERTEKWTGGRYFWNPQPFADPGWYALSCDGSSVQFQRVPLGRYADIATDLFLFDRRGHDGAFALAVQRKQWIDLTQQSEHPLAHEWRHSRVIEVDSTGRRFLLGPDNDHFQKSEKLLRNPFDSVSVYVRGRSLAECDASQFAEMPSAMKRFSRVFVASEAGNEQLMLVSKGQACWYLTCENDTLKLVKSRSHSNSRLSRNFEPLKKLHAGASLQLAEWNDGSRVWIDGRGLLHLQSSDPLIREATFVLHPEKVAVWTSEGFTWGPEYFVGRPWPGISPQDDVVRTILIPFVSRLS